MMLNPGALAAAAAAGGLGFGRRSDAWNFPLLDPPWFSRFSTVLFYVVEDNKLPGVRYFCAGEPLNACGATMANLPEAWSDQNSTVAESRRTHVAAGSVQRMSVR